MKRIALCLITVLFFMSSNCGKPKGKKLKARRAVSSVNTKRCFFCLKIFPIAVYLGHQMRVNEVLELSLSGGAKKLDTADLSLIRQEYGRIQLPLCAEENAVRRAFKKLKR